MIHEPLLASSWRGNVRLIMIASLIVMPSARNRTGTAARRSTSGPNAVSTTPKSVVIIAAPWSMWLETESRKKT